MKLTRRIQLSNSPYLFEISLESKTTESHSLMSDNKDDLEDKLGNLTGLKFELIKMADQHQQRLKG